MDKAMIMPDPAGRQQPASLTDLQHRIAHLERPALAKAKPGDALSLGVAAIDARLPWGGLAPASLHAISAKKSVTPAIGFAAALLGRAACRGPNRTVLWCRRGRDLYAPGLAAFGLHADNLIVVNTADERDLLWAMEEGLRSGAAAAVLGEVQTPSPTALRRLQLAAETGGTTALLLNAERQGSDAGAGMGTSMTHWRVTTAASGAMAGAADGVAWPGPVRWQLELLRCRGAAAGAWLVEWQTEKREDHANDNFGIPDAGAPGRLRLADAVRHGPDPATADARGGERRYAAG